MTAMSCARGLVGNPLRYENSEEVRARRSNRHFGSGFVGLMLLLLVLLQLPVLLMLVLLLQMLLVCFLLEI